MALSILLFAVSIILALRLAQRKKPRWSNLTTKIIGLGTNAPPELKLIFNEKQVNDVYQTLAIFFNAGNKPICREDVRAKVGIRFPGAQILRDPAVIRTSNKSQVKLSTRQLVGNKYESIELDFDFLDHGDGAVVGVLHTACNAPIYCAGYVLEAGEPRFVGHFTTKAYTFTRRRILSYIMAIFVPLAMVAIPMVSDIRDGNFINFWGYAPLPLTIWGFLLLGWVPETVRRLRFPAWSRWQ